MIPTLGLPHLAVFRSGILIHSAVEPRPRNLELYYVMMVFQEIRHIRLEEKKLQQPNVTLAHPLPDVSLWLNMYLTSV